MILCFVGLCKGKLDDVSSARAKDDSRDLLRFL